MSVIIHDGKATGPSTFTTREVWAMIANAVILAFAIGLVLGIVVERRNVENIRQARQEVLRESK